MAKRTYPIMLEPADGGYGVVFPDLPGCVSFAATLDAAIASAEEALSLHLEGMAEDGELFPEATSLQELMLDHPDRSQATVWALVTVEAPDTSERVNIYLAKSLLERIDRFVGAEGGRNRSTFFAIAARRYLDAEAEVARANRNSSVPDLSALMHLGRGLDALQGKGSIPGSPLIDEERALAVLSVIGATPWLLLNDAVASNIAPSSGPVIEAGRRLTRQHEVLLKAVESLGTANFEEALARVARAREELARKQAEPAAKKV